MDQFTGGKKKVLVVDDVAIVLMRTAKTLSGLADVFGARLLAEAIPIIEEQHIDLFILDINLPDGSGMTLLDYIRASERHAKTPVIMLTANASRNNIKTAATKGVTRFIAKPFENKDLLTAFKFCMNIK